MSGPRPILLRDRLSRLHGHDGWVLRFRASGRVLDRTLTTTRAEALEIRRLFYIQHPRAMRLEPVKVRVRLEVVEDETRPQEGEA